MKLETLDDIPESMHDQFEKVEDDGKTFYQDKDALELKKLSFNVKDENKSLKQKLDEMGQTVSQFEETKKAEIEQAKKDALEQARTKGDAKEIEKRYQEQLEDLEKRRGETEKQYEERIEKLSNNLKSQSKSAAISDIANELATDVGYKAFKALIGNRIDVDVETGKVIFLNEDGGASSLDKKGFMEEIRKDEAYKPLVKSGVVTKGGGDVNGNGEGGASGVKTVTRSQFDGMSQKQRSEFSKAGGKIVND